MVHIFRTLANLVMTNECIKLTAQIKGQLISKCLFRCLQSLVVKSNVLDFWISNNWRFRYILNQLYTFFYLDFLYDFGWKWAKSCLSTHTWTGIWSWLSFLFKYPKRVFLIQKLAIFTKCLFSRIVFCQSPRKHLVIYIIHTNNNICLTWS